MIYLGNIDFNTDNCKKIKDFNLIIDNTIKEFQNVNKYEIYDSNFFEENLSFLHSDNYLYVEMLDILKEKLINGEDVYSELSKIKIKDGFKSVMKEYDVKSLDLIVVDDSKRLAEVNNYNIIA